MKEKEFSGYPGYHHESPVLIFFSTFSLAKSMRQAMDQQMKIVD